MQTISFFVQISHVPEAHRHGERLSAMCWPTPLIQSATQHFAFFVGQLDRDQLFGVHSLIMACALSHPRDDRFE